MTDEEESAWLEARAEAELGLAQAADHPAVVRAHYVLAGFYLDRLYNPEDADMVGSETEALPASGRY